MNCPKCGEVSRTTAAYHHQPLTVRVMCDCCGWESPDLEALTVASPAYRLAKLKASGAAPGWYGPDGAKCDLWNDPISNKLLISWRCGNFSEDEARLCGFVEVPHE